MDKRKTTSTITMDISTPPCAIPYHRHFDEVLTEDAEVTGTKDVEYASSWRQRGGVGAFMMLARKWDRIENQCKSRGFNIFECLTKDKRPEGILDDIQDLRRYLLLVEAYIIEHG